MGTSEKQAHEKRERGTRTARAVSAVSRGNVTSSTSSLSFVAAPFPYSASYTSASSRSETSAQVAAASPPSARGPCSSSRSNAALCACSEAKKVGQRVAAVEAIESERRRGRVEKATSSGRCEAECTSEKLALQIDRLYAQRYPGSRSGIRTSTIQALQRCCTRLAGWQTSPRWRRSSPAWSTATA